MKFSITLLLAAFTTQALGDRHHFCWCGSDQVPRSDPCLTQAACAKYPQDKFFGVKGGDPSAPTISKWSEKKAKCYSTRAWPVIPHPFLGGNEFEDACFAAAADQAVVDACGISPGSRTGVKSYCSEPFD
ncbi:uncharacterized protein N0V96_001279 [Colletotrichum fioriniae]|uniref:uncharacterized protein n=1 Tax=Colletotrichum fioriniae TaxID=710243 RepID=UPI002301E196|nr:uncharacterized protein COL516b_005111 [Colletotrichum fioriniae]KAJ0305998.1 hypothetical protein COL516b_005111 [Colletotrichum fioriniae]KAJ3950140.1 hypothetical protein N0V96_001279 [Colletotrichum fioriniae]